MVSITISLQIHFNPLFVIIASNKTTMRKNHLCFRLLVFLFLSLGITNYDLNAQQHQTVPNTYGESFYQSLKWRNIGPYRGGRSLGCAGSPGRPNEYYFGATGGGLWKTTDGGNDWFSSD